ncbi:hypothetical protein, partial [Paraglaciecola marina]|uniref:hypothetical protein n=1 Tax=Paraglaciecola marina TaxID=2500157 RepID=UPI00105DFF10
MEFNIKKRKPYRSQIVFLSKAFLTGILLSSCGGSSGTGESPDVPTVTNTAPSVTTDNVSITELSEVTLAA